MNQEQEVSIPLSEYLTLKEIFEHAKEVKIIGKYETKSGKTNQIGSSVSWESDGKCWVHLANKPNNAGIKFGELLQKYNKLKCNIKLQKERIKELI